MSDHTQAHTKELKESPEAGSLVAYLDLLRGVGGNGYQVVSLGYCPSPEQPSEGKPAPKTQLGPVEVKDNLGPADPRPGKSNYCEWEGPVYVDDIWPEKPTQLTTTPDTGEEEWYQFNTLPNGKVVCRRLVVRSGFKWGGQVSPPVDHDPVLIPVPYVFIAWAQNGTISLLHHFYEPRGYYIILASWPRGGDMKNTQKYEDDTDQKETGQ